MKHIERIENRDGLRSFHFLMNVRKDDQGRVVNASRVTIHGFNVKNAIARFKSMTDNAEFILV